MEALLYDIVMQTFIFLVLWVSHPDFLTHAVVIAVTIFVLRGIAMATSATRRRRRRDRAARLGRSFTSEQKALGHRRAGNRCEFSVGMHRCRARSVHGDHFYPFSRGGATTLKNFVAACEYHNLSKGAAMPSTFEKARIEARRKGYFPALTPVQVGEWA